MKKNILITVLLITQFSCFTSNPNLEIKPDENSKIINENNIEVKPSKSSNLEIDKPKEEMNQTENLSTQKDNTEVEPIPDLIPKPIDSKSSNPLVVSEPECVKEEYPDLPQSKCVDSFKPSSSGGGLQIITKEESFSTKSKSCSTYRNVNIPETDILGKEGYHISLMFKDESRIRWDEEKKEFYSLNCSDVSNINRIMKNNKYKFYFGKSSIENEKKYREKELKEESKYNYDAPNRLSKYTFTNLDNNYKSFIEDFRKDTNVRIINLIFSQQSTAS